MALIGENKFEQILSVYNKNKNNIEIEEVMDILISD